MTGSKLSRDFAAGSRQTAQDRESSEAGNA